MVTYIRECQRAAKIYKCGGCGDPICRDELYTSFKSYTGYSYTQGPRRCQVCEPILMHEGKPLNKAFVKSFKVQNKLTWDEAVKTFGFESYKDYSAYFDGSEPLLYPK